MKLKPGDVLYVGRRACRIERGELAMPGVDIGGGLKAWKDADGTLWAVPAERTGTGIRGECGFLYGKESAGHYVTRAQEQASRELLTTDRTYADLLARGEAYGNDWYGICEQLLATGALED